MLKLANQPFSKNARLGDLLNSSFENKVWTQFDAAIAFVRRSGVRFIYDGLRVFAGDHAVNVRVGVDLNGTSKEGLALLREAVEPHQVSIVHSAGISTFHPKIYVFRNTSEAEVIIGSGNLTAGGLYTNYEGCVAIRLDFTNASHLAFMQDLDVLLGKWSDTHTGAVKPLDDALMAELEAEGYVLSEAQLATAEPVEKGKAKGKVAAVKKALFAALKVPNPPSGTTGQKASTTAQPAVQLQASALAGFVMTLQQTDMGVGQTTAGTSRRSPEIFIPLAARDYAQDFWGWPDEFNEDPAKTGKMDRTDVRMRLAGAVISVNMMTWPDKHDFRLRSEALRSAGEVGDLLRLELAADDQPFDYYASIIPKGSTEYPYYESICSNQVRNSAKRFGYY